MSEPDSTQTQFWTRRWVAGKMPWDLGGVPAPFIQFLNKNRPVTSVLIPGCGSGYEVQAFHAAGFQVTAIEFSEPAVERARKILGPLGDKVIHGNFFKYDFGATRFGMVYERGFLCSFAPTKWPEYEERMARLILPGGTLTGLFVYGHEPEPPPYPLTDESASQLLGRRFRRLSDTPIQDSVPVYKGMEHWQEWERLPD